MTTTDISPKAPTSPATEQSAVPSLDSIAEKMTVMREQTLRNQIKATEPTATGADEDGSSPSPVASDDEAEVAIPEDSDIDSTTAEASARSEEPEEDLDETVSTDEAGTAEDIIDFLDFANDNPTAKFKFMRNGKEVVIDAKKAAAILGQGSAIHEEARQLKIDRSEFDEYVNDARARQEGLSLAMEFTVQPRLKKSYDEIVKVQGYQATFHQQLNQTNDPAEVARIRASMQQNEEYIRQQQGRIQRMQPQVEQFRKIRKDQVTSALEFSRKNFKDKELKNDYVFNEVRGKLEKMWPQGKMEAIPGVPNLDLISSDETILSLLRDGLKYRDRPNSKSAGASMAALTQRKGSSSQKRPDDGIEKLREQAKAGDKKAADNLLMQRLQSIRSASRGSK